MRARACVRPSRKMLALPGKGLNLEAFSSTERVVGYQLGVVESVEPSTCTELWAQKGKRQAVLNGLYEYGGLTCRSV